MYKKIAALSVLSYYWATAQAAQLATQNRSLGDVSEAVLDPLTGLKKIMVAVSTIAGIAFLMATFVQYMDHRKNPVQVPISRPIVYFIIGAAFIIIPYATKISESAKVFFS